MEPAYLTITQAAEIANLSPITIRRAIKSGKLTAYNPTRGARPCWRISRDDLDCFVRGSPCVVPSVVKKGKDRIEYFEKGSEK